MADVVTSYDARKLAWSLEDQPIVKHLDLYLCSLYAVVSMADAVNRHLLQDKGEYSLSVTKYPFSEIGMFLDL